MTNFNAVEENSAHPHKDITEHIRSSLDNNDFSPLLEYLPPVLQQLYDTNSAQAAHITTALANIEQVPKSQWYIFFTLFMSEVISQSETGETAFFDTADFPWVEQVEQCYNDVYQEFGQVSSNIELLPAFQEFHDIQHKLTDDEKWKVFAFQAYGEMLDENLALFPQTATLLNLIPQWTTGMFSILMPGKQIQPHEGPYKGVLRYHLGLTIPSDCGISVKGQQRHWQDGKSLIFDDTFEHFAWNNSSDLRAVLFVDFIRPLPFPLNILNEWVVLSVFRRSDFIQKNIDKSSFNAIKSALFSS